MNQPPIERFCSDCGLNLRPLEVPHISGSCDVCGRTKYFIRLGEGGKGLHAKAGETIAIPTALLQMSLDPSKVQGRLSREGIPYFLQKLLMEGMPAKVDELSERINISREVWENELQQSDKLAGIDLGSPEGGQQMFQRLKEEMDSREWRMLVKIMLSGELGRTIEAGKADEAAYFGLLIGLNHALTVVQEPYFEETVWRGYKAGIAIHECSNAMDIVLGEVEALAELDPLFERTGEATLRTWLDSGSALGPRLGISTVPEALLAARANWHLDEFRRKKEENAKRPAERRAKSELLLKWAQLFIPPTAIGAIIGSLATYLKLH